MSNHIPEDVVDEIRKANNVVDVVGEYVQLKKQGRNYFGLCPFHGENTPSFSVTNEKQIFHCFGCGKGGNVITFMMEIEGFSFFEALRFLAERGGIEIPEEVDPKSNTHTQETHDVLSAYEWLTKLYNHLLNHSKEGKEGKQYFYDRGIEDETIDQFQLGFAPTLKDFIVTFLEKKGFHQQMLVKAGILSVRDDNSVTDRFRGRIMFPIRNHLGKTIAFGGRTINDDGPKYLNSSESDLFQKGRLLYNFDLAKRHIRKKDEVILYEGYMDVISSYQAGIKNVVATLGTALSEVQAKLLKRYVNTVIICFDSDDAGIEATYKAAILLQQSGCNVKIANVDDGMDPDEFIMKNGSELFNEKVIKVSETFIGFLIRYKKKGFNLSLEGDRIKYLELVTKDLATVDSQIERDYYLKELSETYDVSVETLESEMMKHRASFTKQKDKDKKNRYTNHKIATFLPNQRLRPAFHNAERKLLAYMLKNRAITDKVREEIGVGFNIEAHKIIVTHLYAFYEENQDGDVSLFIERLSDDKLRQLVTEIAMLPLDNDISDREINDYLRLIASETNDHEKIKTLKQQQKIAEQQNDPLKAAGIAVEIIKLQKQLKQFN